MKFPEHMNWRQHIGHVPVWTETKISTLSNLSNENIFSGMLKIWRLYRKLITCMSMELIKLYSLFELKHSRRSEHHWTKHCPQRRFWNLKHWPKHWKLYGHVICLTIEAQWLPYIALDLTLKNSRFCPHSAFMCHMWIPGQWLFHSTTLTHWLL